MKNILLATICLLGRLCLLAQPAPPMEKIYGNGEENVPTAVKAFGNGIYVSGYRVIGTDEYATFSKFDLNTGSIQWEKYFELHTRITDFDYEPSTDELFIVGSTQPFASNFDNQSFLARISGNGQQMTFTRYQQNGRERFDRIVRHPNPPNTGAPFYIGGIKNPAPTPSNQEEVVLFNVDLNGAIVWGSQYSITPPDNEFSRGLIVYGNDLILVGNGNSNDGLLLRVSGSNGSVVSAHNYPHVLDIYDAVELQGGFLVMAGEDFSVNQAFVAILDLNFNVLGTSAGLRFTDITNFKDIWLDQSGFKLYAIGENKNVQPGGPPHYAKNYQVVHKLDAFIHPTAAFLTVDWARYLEDPAETKYSNGKISVTPAHNRIFYADARLNNPNGFGNWDMLVGSFDLDLQSACRQNFPINTNPFMPTRVAATATQTPIPAPPAVSPPVIKPFMGGCNNFCAPPPCECDFVWTNTNCFMGFFTVTCTQAQVGNYTYSWDYDCDPNTPPVASTALNTVQGGSFVQTFPYQFPCGGGTFSVCLKVIQPNGTICNISHTVNVPNTCCGSVTGMLQCHPTDPYKYDFTINVTNPPGSTNCTQNLSSAYQLSNVVSTPTSPTTAVITGSIAIPDPVPTSAGFTLQTNCVCITTGLPITCNLPFSLPTVCCKEICVDDHTICDELDEYTVPVYPCKWPPLNNVYQVTWYVMPKPASGICPTPPWGIPPYQSSAVSNNILTPLLLFPNELPSDLCVYAVVNLNDGPCTKIISNAATVQLCKPSACTLDDHEYCYTGTPVPLNPITLTFTGTQPTCLSTLEWFDENDVPQAPPTPLNVFQPPNALSLPVNFPDCYKDFYFKAVLTDDCGQHVCKSRVRLYNDLLPIGDLTIAGAETPPLCWSEDVTLKFDPKCVGEPPLWAWYKKDCNGAVTVLPEAGLNNTCVNLNELFNGEWYGVAAKNGVCPIKTEEEEIQIIDRAVLSHFSAISDLCAEQYVTLTADVIPGLVSCSGAAFPCTYTYEWFKDGNPVPIGVTQGGAANETFTYFNPNPPMTMAGNYYAVITEDCCPRNTILTYVEVIKPACEPTVMGPCFICDNQPETYMAQMVLPPNKPCPDACTFMWYEGVLNGNGDCVPGQSLGSQSTLTISLPGQYFLQSDCNGCIKWVKFDVLACMSALATGQSICGPVVSVEDLMAADESPLRIFPNPTTGDVSIEWSALAPKNARVFITDPMGRTIKMIEVPEAAQSLSTQVQDLPSGLYFIKVRSADRLFSVAKLVKE